nr:polygalacturonase [Quercus suber]
MSLLGAGLIYGRGEKWWNLLGRPDKAMIFASSSDLKLIGLRIKNSPKIHLEKTNNVKIYNSFISTGDDCMSIGNNSHNVDIRNLTFSQICALAVLVQINLELVFQTSHHEGLSHQTLY